MIRRTAARLAEIGLVAMLAVGILACTSASIQEEGGGGKGGVAGADNGPNGSGGLVIDISSRPQGSGGTTTFVCTGPNPSTSCKQEIPEGCGDAINNQGSIEECDDGNALPGDGCNGICKVETNWECPKQGPCTRKIICGDGSIGAGEVCDDGNTKDGDGCNVDCSWQDPAFKCSEGQPCERVSLCGNKRIEAGEDCDDGNSNADDGCSSNCRLEGGFVCPTPGAPCKLAPRCGDGVMQGTIGEVCDDGNQKDGDGCAADCKSKGEGCVCVPGQPCKCPTIECGNGVVEGGEHCDDGNTTPGDGCNGSCEIESGYACPFFNAPCVPDCGDGIVLSPMEQCDPAAPGTNLDKACSSTCKYKEGWACVGDPPNCHETTCGDGKVEGMEGCDLGTGKNVPGSGCSPTCHFEPNCDSAAGSCTSKCGDGLVVNEECDDGNTNDGDGCTHDCKVEGGYECNQPVNTAETMTVPVTYRDFLFTHADFEKGIVGSYNATTGLVQGTLDSEGKPVFAGKNGDGHISSADSFKQWYRDVSGTNATVVSTILLHNNGQGIFVNWWKDDQQWEGYTDVRWCEDATCANCNAPPYVDDGSMKCFAQCSPWGPDNTQTCVANITRMDGNPLFFPLDKSMFSPASEARSAKIPPMYGGNWMDEEGKPLHNFSFTSEVRYWFSYIAKNSYTLEFTGDDDVWVFVNRKLAVDIGGVHTPVNGKLELNATGGATVTVTPTEGDACTTANNVTTCRGVSKTVDLGMQDHGVYEIVVFQAERQTSASTYKLTLSGFNDKPSACGPICGDGVVAPGEQCDNGEDMNTGGYNECTAECRLGPYCGDEQIEEGVEECDNGRNDDDYGATSGCAPNCKLPARCGDSIVQTDFDEECDEGEANLDTTDPTEGYGGCMANCKRGGYCGDGETNGSESCDDGANDGTYGTCNPDCTPAPSCGDGVVQDDYGEECEPKMSDDPECTPACRLPGGCGDGKIQPPEEQCDDGELGNNGEYGGCAPSCIYAPHCGDAIKNGPEECDDGDRDSSYGGCTLTCKLGPHCGDKIINGPEECDDGPDNGKNGLCSDSCKSIKYTPP